MKFLAFVDTHGDNDALKKLFIKAKQTDIILCAGDLTIFENNLEKYMRKLDSIGKPVLIIPGNHESTASLSLVASDTKNVKLIHKSFYLFNDFIFFGWGGGGFALNEPDFDKAASQFSDSWNAQEKKDGKNYKLILVTHAPPYGTKLDDLGEHIGCRNILNFIKKFQPVLAVSGHIHETAGAKDKIGSSIVVNPGPEGMLFEF